MKIISLIKSLAIGIICFTFAFSANAQTKKEPVLVKAVQFSSEKYGNGGNSTWTKVSVALEATEEISENSIKGWVKDVELTVMLGYENPNDKDGKYIFFGASQSVIALKSKTTAVFTFVIPWEIVEILELNRGEPKFWYTEVSVAGKAIEPSATNYKKMISKSLQKKDVFNSFKTLARQSMGKNAGYLMPINKAPFYVQYINFDRGGEKKNTPTVLPEK